MEKSSIHSFMKSTDESTNTIPTDQNYSRTTKVECLPVGNKDTGYTTKYIIFNGVPVA